MSLSRKLQQPPADNNICENSINNSEAQKLINQTTLDSFISSVQNYIDTEFDKGKDLDYPIKLYKEIDEQILKKEIAPIFYTAAYNIVDEVLQKYNYRIEHIAVIEEIFSQVVNNFISRTEYHKTIFNKTEQIIKDAFINKFDETLIKEFIEFEYDTVKIVSDKRIQKDRKTKNIKLENINRHELWDIYKTVLLTRVEITLTFYYIGLLNYLFYRYLKNFIVANKFNYRTNSKKDWFYAMVRHNIVNKSRLTELVYTNIFRPASKYAYYFIIRSIQDEFNNAIVRYHSIILKAYKNNPEFSDKLLFHYSYKYFIIGAFFRDNFFKVRKLSLYIRVIYNNALRNLLFSIRTPEINKNNKQNDNDETYVRWKYMVFDGSTLQFDIYSTNLSNTVYENAIFDIEQQTEDIDNFDILFDKIGHTIKFQNNTLIQLYSLYKQYLNNEKLSFDTNEFNYQFFYKEIINHSILFRKNLSMFSTTLEVVLTRLSVDLDTVLRKIKRQNLVELFNIHVYIEPVINILWNIDKLKTLDKEFNNSLLWYARKPILFTDYIKNLNKSNAINSYNRYYNIIIRRNKKFRLENQKQIINIIHEMLKHSLQFKISINEFKDFLSKREFKLLISKFSDYLLIAPEYRKLIQTINNIITNMTAKNNLLTEEEIEFLAQFIYHNINNSLFIIPHINYIIPIGYIKKITNIDILDLILKELLKLFISKRLIIKQ